MAKMGKSRGCERARVQGPRADADAAHLAPARRAPNAEGHPVLFWVEVLLERIVGEETAVARGTARAAAYFRAEHRAAGGGRATVHVA
jgi:hypothetical protein